MGRAKGGPGHGKARPSSSSVAAAHLQVPGVAPLGFGGYVGSSLVDTTLPTEREVSTDLDGEAAVYLKRLSKRDSTTKLKALAALRGIFKEHSIDEPAAILMTWVFEYKRLVQDNNRQVRESAHNAMADLTTNAGRGLAPHLRSLMGAWWVAQFDPSREVAEAAQHSFQATFPERKRRVDALIYCMKDIVNHLDENLNLMPQSLTELGTPPEEVAEKIERIFSSSLLALAALLDVLVGSTSSLWREGPAEGTSATNAAEGAGEAVKLATKSLFHKHKSLQSFLKNNSSQVRSAAYQALRTYIQHIPEVFTDDEKLDDSVKLVLGSLGEKATSCHQPMWDMVLLFSKGFPEAWGCGCIRKAVLPKLWDFLRHGCFGSQNISYPYVFPFMALIPPQYVAPPQGFFLQFFGSLWNGGNFVSMATKDRLALLKAFQECFVWVVRNGKRYATGEDLKELRNFVVEEVLLKIVWYHYMTVNGQLPPTHDLQDQHSSASGAVGLGELEVLSQEALDEVAMAIVDIMTVLGLEEGVLDAFWPGFQIVCLNLLLERSPENKIRLARLAEFFSMLDSLKHRTEVQWPLKDVVQPFVAKAFPAIRSLGHPEAISLLGQLTSSFGTSAFAWTEQAVSTGVQQLFQKDMISWCLTAGDNEVIASKVELLLAFLEVKEFQCYWVSVVEHATAWLRPGIEASDLSDEDLVQVGVLATLVGKFSERFDRLIQPDGDVMQNWRSSRLDTAGLAVASSNSLPDQSCLRLLRNLLGAKNPPLLSPGAAVCILDKLLQHLLAVLSLHDLPWTRAAPPYILLGQVYNGLGEAHIDDSKKAKYVELATSALEVVGALSLPLVHMEDEPIGSQLLSAIFCLYWAFLRPSLHRVAEGDLDDSEDETRDEEFLKTTSSSLDGHELPSSETQLDQSRKLLANCLQSLRKNSSPVICQGLSTLSRGRIRWILVEVARNALLDGNFSDAVATSTLCAGWVHEVVDYFCVGENEIQDTINLALAPSMSWPLWAGASMSKDDLYPMLKFPQETRVAEVELQNRFCVFADVLAIYLKPQRVYAGCASMPLARGSVSYRVWLVIELLCTQEWSGGSVSTSVLIFLCQVAKHAAGQKIPALLEMCVLSLLSGSSSNSQDEILQPMNVQGDEKEGSVIKKDPYANALLFLLRALLDGEAPWGRADAKQFFLVYISKSKIGKDTKPLCTLRVLPSVLSILMPVLRQPMPEPADDEGSQTEGLFLKDDVSEWLNKALNYAPFVSPSENFRESEGKLWLQVAIACFPLHLSGVKSGIAAASTAKVSLQETSLLLKLLRSQSLLVIEDNSQVLSAEQAAGSYEEQRELALANLIAVSVAYCWQDFGVEEWAFVLGHLRKWLDSAVVEFEEMTEIIVSFFKEGQQGELGLQHLSGRKVLIELAATAVSILILLKDLHKLESVTALRALATLRLSNWEAVEDHLMENILRILLATGLSESAAMESSVNDVAVALISKHRMAESFLWEGLADVALGATSRSREAAVRAADLWGVGRGSISALYALLLSTNSSGALQWVAFQFLATEPLQQLAVTWGGISVNQVEVEDGAQQEAANEENSLSAIAKLRPELAKVLETPATQLFQSPFTSSLRVQYLLGWSLFLIRLQGLPPLSPTRERLLQFAQESNTPSTLLDCLYQHIPLDLTSGTSASRRRAAAVGAKISVAATSATRAVSTGSVRFAVQNLWPVREENLVGLAGAVYGLLLRVLPACVRIWFTGLRERSTALAIENFTSSNCSLHLLADEFSQLQASVVADDTLSIRANRTLREVTAAYIKEEAGLDIVIRLPTCYPLRAVEVDCTRRLGINETLLRKWILSMASFLRNQNGALLEAIQMWKKNVDREFEGVEECPICYSIIHTTNHSLPRLACKTCKHKFHSACLYKWFSTSHKSTCPLCQTPF